MSLHSQVCTALQDLADVASELGVYVGELGEAERTEAEVWRHFHSRAPFVEPGELREFLTIVVCFVIELTRWRDRLGPIAAAALATTEDPVN